MIHVDLIKGDLLSAKSLIETYKKTKARGVRTGAAYHIQQAIEKIIKQQIYTSGKDYNNYKIYTHNIQSLIEYANKLGVNINTPEYIKEHAIMITDWGVIGRYDIHLALNIRSLERAYDETYKWYKKVRKNL